jgi:hypothetical protein
MAIVWPATDGALRCKEFESFWAYVPPKGVQVNRPSIGSSFCGGAAEEQDNVAFLRTLHGPICSGKPRLETRLAVVLALDLCIPVECRIADRAKARYIRQNLGARNACNRLILRLDCRRFSPAKRISFDTNTPPGNKPDTLHLAVLPRPCMRCRFPHGRC